MIAYLDLSLRASLLYSQILPIKEIAIKMKLTINELPVGLMIPPAINKIPTISAKKINIKVAFSVVMILLCSFR